VATRRSQAPPARKPPTFMNPLFGVAIILFGHQPRPEITDSFVVPSGPPQCSNSTARGTLVQERDRRFRCKSEQLEQ
jgi:hypothetical protein